MKRLLAMLLATALMLGVVALSNGMGRGHRTDGLYYTVTDIHPDAGLLKINGTSVSAEEYLYWLSYNCEYLTTYDSDLDWDAPVSDGMTYAQYAKADALEAVKLYAIVRQWAKEGRITLSEEDRANLEAERQQYVAYYGGEEGYDQQIQLLGVSKETYADINAVYYLYNKLLQESCTPEGKCYPGDKTLQAYGTENGYVTAKLLYLSTVGLEKQDAIDALQTTAEKYAKQLRESDDRNATYAKLAEELGLSTEGHENGITFSVNDTSLDAKLMSAINALEEGKVSDVISCDNGFYVAIRMPLDQEAVASAYFDNRLQEARSSAKVTFRQELYDSIDAGEFYADLLQARSDLAQRFASDTKDVPSSDSSDAATAQTETDTAQSAG